MPQFAAARSVRLAARELKRMNYQGEGWEDWREASRGAVKRVLEEHMQRARYSYLAGQAVRGVQDRCNGHYRRQLLTSLGAIELAVPRTRTYSAIRSVQRYARREEAVDRMILACFVLGLSTRKVGEALLPILGERVSAATVSRVGQALDEAVAGFHGRRLKDRYKILVLDGVVLSHKTGAGAVRRPVLVALGITPQGKKEILDFRLAPAESQVAWETFLTDLHTRGLKGTNLKMIVTDGGSGLLAALPTVYPHIPAQRCWAHKTRNILDRVRKGDREAVKRDLHRITHADNRRVARRAARHFADQWHERYPRAVASLRRDLDDLLLFLCLADADWRKAARTTNAIERRFREVRRRTRPMGVFSDRTSVQRILFAVFTHENRKAGTGTPFLLTQKT